MSDKLAAGAGLAVQRAQPRLASGAVGFSSSGSCRLIQGFRAIEWAQREERGQQRKGARVASAASKAPAASSSLVSSVGAAAVDGNEAAQRRGLLVERYPPRLGKRALPWRPGQKTPPP